MSRLNLSAAVLLLAAAFIAAGCSDDDNPSSPSQSQKSLVRVAHLSPDAPAVDIWVDGSVVLEDVAFRGVSPYLQLPAGAHRVQVTPAGEDEPVVIDATVTLASSKAYTVAATGLLGENDLNPIVLEDNRSANATGSLVRFVHASPDAPAVDVQVASGPTLFDDIGFREAGAYGSVAAGTYNLEVRLASGGGLALAVPGVTLTDGTNYTIFAVGLAGDGTLQALAVADTE